MKGPRIKYGVTLFGVGGIGRVFRLPDMLGGVVPDFGLRPGPEDWDDWMDISDINKWLMLFGLLAFGIVACDGGAATQDGPGLTAAPEYLTEVIPPCTPVPGFSVDPCETGREPLSARPVGSIYIGFEDDPPFGIQYFLEGTDDYVPHIVLRGTYLPGTVRCSPTTFRPRPYLGPEAYGSLRGNPELLCYADVRVNAYIIGSGPSVLTVLVAHDIYYPHTDEEVENRKRFWERALTEEGADHHHFEVEPIVGREAMLFIGPAVGTSVEVWRVFHNWNIEQGDDGTVVAVHPHSRYFSAEKQQKHRSIMELELPAFKKAVVAAQAARVAANDGRVLPEDAGGYADTPVLPHPKLITDVHDLPKFFREVGAYDHPDGPPAQPPPAR